MLVKCDGEADTVQFANICGTCRSTEYSKKRIRSAQHLCSKVQPGQANRLWVQDAAASRGTGGGSAAWPKSSARWLPNVRAESCSTLWSQCPRDQRCAPASRCRLPVLAEAASVSRKTGLQAIKQRLPARCRECKGHEVRENLASAQIAEIRLLSISSTEALLKL